MKHIRRMQYAVKLLKRNQLDFAYLPDEYGDDGKPTPELIGRAYSEAFRQQGRRPVWRLVYVNVLAQRLDEKRQRQIIRRIWWILCDLPYVGRYFGGKFIAHDELTILSGVKPLDEARDLLEDCIAAGFIERVSLGYRPELEAEKLRLTGEGSKFVNFSYLLKEIYRDLGTTYAWVLSGLVALLTGVVGVIFSDGIRYVVALLLRV